jgi:chaperonin GroEL
VLLLLELHLGGGTDLDDADAAGQLGQPLLQLLAVPVGVGRLDLGLSGDEAVGVRIVRKSVDEPLRWIAENGGENGYVIVAKVREAGPGTGYNAATGQYGDLVAQGVLDPVKVTRSALTNATSIAGMLLTTETLVVEKPADEEPEAAGHGHGHGH